MTSLYVQRAGEPLLEFTVSPGTIASILADFIAAHPNCVRKNDIVRLNDKVILRAQYDSTRAGEEDTITIKSGGEVRYLKDSFYMI